VENPFVPVTHPPTVRKFAQELMFYQTFLKIIWGEFSQLAEEKTWGSQLFSLPSFTSHQVWLTPLAEDG
jgi:hypothetical protein